MAVEFVYSGLKNFQACLQENWFLTNGVGAYCASSIIGAHDYLQQGYLVASLNPPLDRIMVLSKTEEKITCGGRIFDLSTAVHQGKNSLEYNIGNQFLKNFKYDGCATFVYECGRVKLTKEITLVQNENTCIIRYIVENSADEAKLSITPLLNFRDCDEELDVDTLKSKLYFEMLEELPKAAESNKTIGFYYPLPLNDKYTVSVAVSEGAMVGRYKMYDDTILLSHGIDEEQSARDCAFAPLDFSINVPAGGVKEISFVCQLTKTTKKGVELSLSANTAEGYLLKAKSRIEKLLKETGFEEETENAKVLMADQSLLQSQYTGYVTVLEKKPWKLGNGRDILLNFKQLVLDTQKYKQAKEILISFSKNVKNGLMPNEFTKGEKKPVYNSVDASLLYFEAVYQYINCMDDDESWELLKEEIFPVLQQILNAYRRGTDLHIKMQENGLLNAGDVVSFDEWQGLPCGEKPYEVNELWLNALLHMEYISRGIAKRSKEKAADYLAYAAGLNDLSVWVKDSLSRR